MNKAKRTALIYQLCSAALDLGIEKPFNFKDVSASRVRRIGVQFLTPRTHSNHNRDKQRRRKALLARLEKARRRRQNKNLESALSN